MSAIELTEHRRASDVSAYDVAALLASVASVAGAMIAAARIQPGLMAVSAVIGLVAAVSKVLSTRSKAPPGGRSGTDRDRRRHEAVGRSADRGAAIAS